MMRYEITTEDSVAEQRESARVVAVAGRAKHSDTLTILGTILRTLFLLGALYHLATFGVAAMMRMIEVRVAGALLDPLLMGGLLVTVLIVIAGVVLAGQGARELPNLISGRVMGLRGFDCGSRRLRIDPDGVTCDVVGVRHSYGWNAFNRIVETERCVVLQGPSHHVMLPKRAFTDAALLSKIKQEMIASIANAQDEQKGVGRKPKAGYMPSGMAARKNARAGNAAAVRSGTLRARPM